MRIDNSEDKARGPFIKLMEESQFANPNKMLVSDRALKKAASDHDEVRDVFRALAVGDHDDFISKAERLGISKDQAELAARDTAAFAALVIQIGYVASW